MSRRRHSTLYWICQALGWGSDAAGNWLMVNLQPPRQAAVSAVIFAWAALTGVLLSHRWRGFLRARGWLERAAIPWPRVALGLMILGAAQTALVTLADAVLRSRKPSFDNLRWLLLALLIWTLTFLIWTTLYAAVLWSRRARRAELEKLELEVLAKSAELRALHAQLNPHFLFNSMNSIRAMVFESSVEAARMIDELSQLLRYALNSSRRPMVPFAEELQMVRTYLSIEKIRFEERLQVREEVDAGLDTVNVPPMLVQTLVENAVKYGVEGPAGPREVRIAARRDGARVRIEVGNTGALSELVDSTRLGLGNARHRLRLLFGDAATLELGERDGWITAAIVLPASAPPREAAS